MAEKTVAAQYADSLLNLRTALEQTQDLIGSGEEVQDQDQNLALERLAGAIKSWQADVSLLAASATQGEEKEFLEATAEVRAGYLMRMAAEAIDTGDKAVIAKEIKLLDSEYAEAKAGRLLALLFDKDSSC